MSGDQHFCPNCGSRNEADAHFCESCGEQLEDAPVSPAGAAPAASRAEAATASSPAGRPRVPPWLVAGGLAVLVGVPAIAFRGSIGRLVGLGAGPQKTVPAAPHAPDTLVDIPAVVPGTGGSAPTRRRPPAPPLGSWRSGTAASASIIAAGSVMSLGALDRVCASQSREGDEFRAAVHEAVPASNGTTIRRGTIVTLVVDRVSGGVMYFSTRSIEIEGVAYALDASVDAVAVTSNVTTPPLPPGIPKGAVVTRGNLDDMCIEPNAKIRIKLTDDFVMPP